ncbi:MAG: hypothetical protein QM722_08875 [Piscinibacter sp.]
MSISVPLIDWPACDPSATLALKLYCVWASTVPAAAPSPLATLTRNALAVSSTWTAEVPAVPALSVPLLPPQPNSTAVANAIALNLNDVDVCAFMLVPFCVWWSEPGWRLGGCEPYVCDGTVSHLYPAHLPRSQLRTAAPPALTKLWTTYW